VSTKDDLTTMVGFIKFLRRKNPHDMITVDTVADILESIIVPPKQSENVSDEPNRYEKVSCIPEQTEGRILVDFHDTITTEEAEEYLDSLPRTKKKPNDEVNSKLW